jgi:hypothetical protein
MMSKIKIGIVYVCVGKYNVFWNDFYEASERNLFSNSKYEKHYFAITTNIINKYNNVVIKYSNSNKYPIDTLKKFHYILLFENELKNMDYVYYFNANSRAMVKINEDILPDNNEIVVSSNTYFIKCEHIEILPFERNPKSTAYVGYYNQPDKYIVSSLFGAKTNEFISMCKELKNNIDIDLKNGIIAIWHDESHLNHYLLTHQYKLLPPEYDYIDDYNSEFPDLDCKILLINKNKYGGLDYLRYNNKKFINRKFFR